MQLVFLCSCYMRNNRFHIHTLKDAKITGYQKSGLEFRENHSEITAEILLPYMNTAEGSVYLCKHNETEGCAGSSFQPQLEKTLLELPLNTPAPLRIVVAMGLSVI